MRLLIVEDDPELSAVLKEGFGEHHMDAVLASDFAQGRERMLFGTYDVIILDVMLPGGSGFDLCGDLRKKGISTPVLMLTARDSVNDRVRGLEQGADDYVPKPFAFRELLARVKALARRKATIAPTMYRVDDLEMDFSTPLVRRSGREIRLTAKELALLECLAARSGQ